MGFTKTVTKQGDGPLPTTGQTVKHTNENERSNVVLSPGDDMHPRLYVAERGSASLGRTLLLYHQVTVHCTGYGKNNDLSVPFWSTKDKGQKPFEFQIGKVAPRPVIHEHLNNLVRLTICCIP